MKLYNSNSLYIIVYDKIQNIQYIYESISEDNWDKIKFKNYRCLGDILHKHDIIGDYVTFKNGENLRKLKKFSKNILNEILNELNTIIIHIDE